MSWLDIFKRKPQARWSVVGVSFEDDPPAPDKVAYTAKEVAEAGVSDEKVQSLVWDITAKSYVVAQKGHTGIRYSHENANLLKLAGQQLKGMGYSVRFDPGDDGFSPHLAISW